MGESWQPIETAPKDGTQICVLSVPDEIEGIVRPAAEFVAGWNPEGYSWVDKDGNLGGEAFKLARTGNWRCSGGWLQPNEVSHWRPLREYKKKEDVTP